MADSKISELPSAGTPLASDLIPVARPGAVSPNVRMTVQALADYVAPPIPTVLTITASGTYSATATTRLIEIKPSATGTVAILLPHALTQRIVIANYKTDSGSASIATLTAVAPTSGGGAARTIGGDTSVAEIEGFGTTATLDPSSTDWIIIRG